MTRQVSFNTEVTNTADITIYDENDNEVTDYDLFSSIIDELGFACDYCTTHEIEFKGKNYKVSVENTEAESMYVSFEIY